MSCIIKAALLALTAAVAVAPSALAQAAEAPRSITVAYGDLDLSTSRGAERLLARVMSASRRVCGPPGKEIPEQRAWKACAAAASAQAVADLNAPAVTALYQKKFGLQEQFASARTPGQ